jgi:hypothetical protein
VPATSSVRSACDAVQIGKIRSRDLCPEARSRIRFATEADMPIRLEDHLFDLEEKFWTEGPSFYENRLAYTALMVFPEPAGVLLKDEIAPSLADKSRWAQVELEEHRLLELGEQAALITYKATAARADGGEPYRARASSVYVRDGAAWKLAFHQQTPV